MPVQARTTMLGGAPAPHTPIMRPVSPPQNLSPHELHTAVSQLDRTLQERRGPWTHARARALALDDHARILQDKARLWKDRAALATARSSHTPDRAEMVREDRASLVEDRARLLGDRSHLFSDKAKLLQGRERSASVLDPDVPKAEMAAVSGDKQRLLKDRSRMFEDKALLLRDSAHLVTDYGARVGGGAMPSGAATAREDKHMLHADHYRLRKDFHNIYEDRRELHRDEHSTVGDIRHGWSKQGHPSFANDHEHVNEPVPHRHQITESTPVSVSSIGVPLTSRFMLGVLGGILICAGAIVMYRVCFGSRRDKLTGSETGDRIPLRTGDPRVIPVS
eukprot:CAMPEP_0206236008 /NCGR_PEP_ID=MMETSP0047_2-20121206/13472_1 /ASSEMBLY_ACC=CAM_ASM_000192 /TAXON_ID=195065 /ORGANISM="Chroomonas mesostigmatica_cf, Strain CCMP1168" /LENGTH=335 /DNA_ID=CAMNT_0053660287 /DNA_START=48 /DNA_END=1055 /DNA_ORIENTATION=-